VVNSGPLPVVVMGGRVRSTPQGLLPLSGMLHTAQLLCSDTQAIRLPFWLTFSSQTPDGRVNQKVRRTACMSNVRQSLGDWVSLGW
jgi:hypothetical protein